MADKLPILPMAFVQDVTALRAWAVAGVEDKHITRRQFLAAVLLASRHVPCQVTLLQRSPKSVLYLRVDDLEYRIGQRAQLYGAKPKRATST